MQWHPARVLWTLKARVVWGRRVSALTRGVAPLLSVQDTRIPRPDTRVFWTLNGGR